MSKENKKNNVEKTNKIDDSIYNKNPSVRENKEKVQRMVEYIKSLNKKSEEQK